VRKQHRKLSIDDLLYLARVWDYFSQRREGVDDFYGYYTNELDRILKTNPIGNTDTYQGVAFHFRADDDVFEIKKGISIRRLYPWEYSELILEILQMKRSWTKLPALETLAEANFVLEVSQTVLRGDDDWARLEDMRTIVNIISVASKGHVWIPLFKIRRNGLIRWDEGVRGSDFRGLIGIVPIEQTSVFVNRVRRGLDVRDNSIIKSVNRSLRQEEDDYGLEFRLVKLFSSLERLMGSPGTGCGMKLAWLLGEKPLQRKRIFEEFENIKKLRDRIIHEVRLYDSMSTKEQSDTLDSIHKLHDWLFDAIVNFLDSRFAVKDWQDDLTTKLFGRLES